MANRTKVDKKSVSSSWFKNVAKSLGYTSAELISSMTPSMGEFATSNFDYAKELVKDIREIRTTGSRFKDSITKNPQIGIARKALSNALEDIKSGKIKNKDREEALFSEGNDVDFGMEDFDFDGGEEGSKTPTPVINIRNVQPPISKDSPIIRVMEQTNSSVVKAAQATNDVNISLATNKMILDHKNHNRMMSGLQTMNDNLAMLVNFQSDSMTKYIGASLKYYEESLKAMGETLNELKASKEVKLTDGKNKQYRDPSEEIFLGGGGLNLRGYMGMVKRNLSNQFSSNPMLAPLKMMFDDTDTLKLLAASPLSFISTKIVSTLIPTMLQNSMSNLDKSFSNFFPALFMKFEKMSKNSTNPIWQLIGDVFGLNQKQKNTVDLGRYNKGATPFDGITRKAITEVIPGYLRKILAALNGKEELGFDTEEGKFKTMKEMNDDYNRKKEMQALSAYGSSIDSIKRMAEAFTFELESDRKKFNESVDKFFVEMTKKGQANPNLRMDKNGRVRDELAEVHDFGNQGFLKLFRSIVLSLPKSEQQAIFGKNIINARNNVRRMMEEAEADPMRYNAALVNNGLGYDEHIKRNKKTGTFTTVKGFGVLGQVDKYNKNSLDYLRDIKKILLQGIRVFPVTPLDGGGRRRGGSGGSNPGSHLDNALDKMKKEEKSLRDKEAKSNSNEVKEYTQDQIDRLVASGRSKPLSPSELAGLTDNELKNQLNVFNNEENKSEDKNKKGGLLQWVGKFFKGDAQDKYNLIREKIDKILNKPAELLKGVFDKIDNTMYEIVFGKDTDETGKVSFLQKTMASFKEKFNTFGKYMHEKILDPIKDKLFGKEGLFNKIKDSEFFKNLKEKGSKFADFLFGKAGSDGARKDGLLSDTGNNILDMWDAAKYYFTGKGYVNRKGDKFDDNPNSVFGEVKSILGNFKTTIKTYLVGDKKSENPNDQKGILTGAINSIKSGFNNFSEAFFGPKHLRGKNGAESVDELAKKVKERAPKALAAGIVTGGAGLIMGGKLGLLGSLLLPGGPIGAAVVGTTVGFLSQSDRFKNWLFGEEKDGERVGGFITKKTQDFLKKNRVGIIGGATMGAARSMLGIGLLPSFLMPGGPIGGAILGMGTSMFLRSETFQKFMFGEKDPTDPENRRRLGGMVQKLFGKDAKGKKLIGNVGAGVLGGAGLGMITSNLGIMGAMLVPGGPIGGAILGAAAGIALSSEKWKKALFGEWDEKTGLRKGGMLGKFQNWFKLEVQEPMKLKFKEINLNIREWFTKSIANPFMDALSPIKQEFKKMSENLQKMFVKGWDTFKEKIGDVFEKHVGQPFGKFMEERVMKPLKSFFSKMLTGVGRVFGAILSSPFKALSSITESLTEKHKKDGVKKYVEDVWDKDGRKKRGEKMGVFSTTDKDGNKVGKGFFGRFMAALNPTARNEAKYGPDGAYYDNKEERERKAKRDAEQKEQFAKEREALASEGRKLGRRRKLGAKFDYDNFTEDGKDISFIYGKKSPLVQAANSTTEEVSKSNKILESIKRILKNGLGASDDEMLGMNVNVGGLKRVKNIGKMLVKHLPKIDGSHASGLDNVENDGYVAELHKGEMVLPARIANAFRRMMGIGRKSESDKKGSVNASNAGVNGLASAKSADKDSVFGRMTMYLRRISEAVDGQLDGVGSNVYKIRKIVQGTAGIDDADLKGSANKDRRGFFGKLRAAFMRPLDFVKEKFMEGITFVTEKVKKFGRAIFEVGKAIVMLPINIGKAAWEVTKEIAYIGKEAALALVKIPLELTKIISAGVQTVVEGIKMVGPAIGESLKGVAKLFSGAMGMAAHAMIGFGKGVGEVFLEAGKGVGQFIGTMSRAAVSLTATLGKFLGNAASMIVDFTFSATKTAVEFTLSSVKMLSEKLLDVGNAMLTMVTSPLKFLAGTIGKFVGFKQEVVVKGGYLDSVGAIGVLPDGVKATKMSNDVVPSVSPISGGEPMKVIIAGSEVCVPVYLCPDKIMDSFKKIFPIPVTMETPSSGSSKGRMRRTGKQADFFSNVVNALESVDEKSAEDQKGITVRRKTATYQQQLAAAAEEKEFTRNNETTQTALLGKIADATTVHKDSWLKIFGDKGMLTLAIIAAMPFLKDIFKAIKGLVFPTPGGGFSWGERQGPERTDADGNHVADGEQREDIVKGAAKLGAKAYVKYGGSAVTKLATKVGRTAWKYGGKQIVNAVDKYVAEPVMEAAEKYVAKPLKNAAEKYVTKPVTEKLINPALKAVGKVPGVKETVIAGNIVADTMKKDAEKIIGQIKELFNKFFSTSFFKDKMGKSGEKAAGPIMSMIEKTFTNETVQKYMGRLSKAFIKTGVKEGAAALTFGITDAAFATWDLTSGAFEAAHMFQVNEETVDTKMRIAASVTKALFGFFPIVSVVADLISEISGVNLKLYFAEAMYSALASDEDVKKLSENQNAFKQEAADYNGANGTELTLDAYNDKVNKSLWQKVTDPISKGASKAWNATKAGTKWLGGKIADGAKATWQGAKWVGGKIADGAKATWQGAKWVGGKIAEGAEWAGDKLKQGAQWVGNEASAAWDATKKGASWLGGKIADGASWVGNEASAAWNGIKSGAKAGVNATWNGIKYAGNKLGNSLGLTDDAVKNNFGVTGDGKVTAGMRISSGIGSVASKLTGGLIDSEGITKTIYGIGLSIKDLWNGISKVVTNVGKDIWDVTKKSWATLTKMVSDTWDQAKGLWKEYVSDPISKMWDSIKQGVSQWATDVWDVTKKGWKAITDPIVKVWDDVKTSVVEFGTNIWDVTKNSWSVLTKMVSDTWDQAKSLWNDYVSTPIANLWSTIKEGVIQWTADIWDVAKKGWKAISDPIVETWDNIKETVVKFGTDLWEGTKKGWNAITGRLSDEWTNIKDVISEKISNLGKSTGKIWDEITEPITKTWKDVKDVTTKSFNTIMGWVDEVVTVVKTPIKKILEFFGKKTDAEMKDLGFESKEGGKGESRSRKQGGFGPGGATRSRGSFQNELGGFGADDKLNNFVYYSQNDERWKDYNYDLSPQVGGHDSNPTLSYRGCGPTSMAMVVSQLTGKEYTPPQMADLARAGGYSTQAGTAWSYFDAVAKKFNLTENKFQPDAASMATYLNAGVPVVLSGTRSSSNYNDSPFTTAGHFVVAVGMDGDDVIINDPRGRGQSKKYKLSNVLKETKQGWAFKYNGGPLPDLPTQDSTKSTTNGINSMGILDLFGKMSENFSVYLNNILYGKNDKLDWGDNASESAANASLSNFNLDTFVPKTVQERILKKAVEMTVSGEGNYFTAQNDKSGSTGQAISPSIGILQWREGNARKLMQAIANELPGNSDAAYFANQVNWNDTRPWSQSEQQRLQNFLKANPDVVKKAEDQMAISYVQDTNLNPVYKYGVSTNKIKDPRSIVLLADLANTGPGLVQPFLDQYQKGNGAEFPSFVEQLKSSKSYWGRNLGTYGSRINSAVSALQNWDPEQGGFGGFDLAPSANNRVQGGFGDLAASFTERMLGDDLDSVTTTRTPSTVGMGMTDSYTTTKGQQIVITGNSGCNEILEKIVDVLETIADNTGTTAKGVISLSSKPSNVTVNNGNSDNTNNNTTVAVTPSGSYNINPMIGAIESSVDNKAKAEYSRAKAIASGRVR